MTKKSKTKAVIVDLNEIEKHGWKGKYSDFVLDERPIKLKSEGEELTKPLGK